MRSEIDPTAGMSCCRRAPRAYLDAQLQVWGAGKPRPGGRRSGVGTAPVGWRSPRSKRSSKPTLGGSGWTSSASSLPTDVDRVMQAMRDHGYEPTLPAPDEAAAEDDGSPLVWTRTLRWAVVEFQHPYLRPSAWGSGPSAPNLDPVRPCGCGGDASCSAACDGSPRFVATKLRLEKWGTRLGPAGRGREGEPACGDQGDHARSLGGLPEGSASGRPRTRRSAGASAFTTSWAGALATGSSSRR
jgi:hypothetical protein